MNRDAVPYHRYFHASHLVLPALALMSRRRRESLPHSIVLFAGRTRREPRSSVGREAERK